jgi:hypothetical protein
MYNVLKVVFALAINTDIDKPTQLDEYIKTTLSLQSNVKNEIYEQIFRKISSRRGMQ